MFNEVRHEVPVLLLDGVLVDPWKQPDDASTHEAQAAGDKERILALLDHIIAAIRLDDWKDVVADDCMSEDRSVGRTVNLTLGVLTGADFAHSSCDGVVLTTNTSGGGLRCYKSDVVPWTHFTKHKED